MLTSRFEQQFARTAKPNLFRHFGVSVTLTRDGDSSDSFTARRSRVDSLPIGLDYEVRLNVEMRKYKLPIAECVIDDVTVKPASGDTITEGTTVWKILPPEEYALAVELSEGQGNWDCFVKKISG